MTNVLFELVVSIALAIGAGLAVDGIYKIVKQNKNKEES